MSDQSGHAYLFTNKVGILIPTYQEIGHLHLSGMWLCVDPKTYSKNTFVLEEKKNMCSKYANYSRFHNQYDRG
jgi:hypothetical protein